MDDLGRTVFQSRHRFDSIFAPRWDNRSYVCSNNFLSIHNLARFANMFQITELVFLYLAVRDFLKVDETLTLMTYWIYSIIMGYRSAISPANHYQSTVDCHD